MPYFVFFRLDFYRFLIIYFSHRLVRLNMVLFCVVCKMQSAFWRISKLRNIHKQHFMF